MQAHIITDPVSRRVKVWVVERHFVRTRNLAGNIILVSRTEAASTDDIAPTYEFEKDDWDVILEEVEKTRDRIPREVVELQEEDLHDARTTRDRLLTLVERLTT